MAKKYLDDNGVRYLWTKLKNWVNSAVPSKTEVASNTEARHTHGNKNVIDGITANNISNWDRKVENYIVTLVEHGDDESGYTYTCDNWQGIEDAYNNHKRVFLHSAGYSIPISCVESGMAIFTIVVPFDETSLIGNMVSINTTDGSTTIENYIYSIPTKTSELTNDSGFITSADGGNAATVNGVKIVVASEPPTSANNNTITFVV